MDQQNHRWNSPCFAINIRVIPAIREYFLIPNHLVLFEGSQYSISKSLPVSAKTSESSDGISLHDEQASITLGAEKPGTNEVLLDVAGLPVKKVDVKVLKDFKVIPGGQSIGVKLNTLGVLSSRSSS